MNMTSRGGHLLLITFCAFAFVAYSGAQNPQHPQPQSNPYAPPPPASQTGQQNFPPQLLDELAAIKSAALADDYAYRQVAHLTENIGPRPAGSLQAKAASEYVADELRHLGLEVRLEEVKVPHWVRGAEAAELVEYAGQVPGTTQKIALTALGGSTSTPIEGISADVIVVNNFDELKALGRERVAGKIMLFNELFDKQKAAAGMAFMAYGEAVRYRGTGPKAAADLGAAAALVRSVGNADYRLPHTGWSLPAGIPAGAVTAEDAELIAHLAAQGKVRMRLTLTPQKVPDETGFNVIADVKGSEHPEQVVVVSGHLDSWDLGTGAIDDAAGVSIAMETAELLQRLHLHSKRTLRVIAWMNEEMGATGRDVYAKDYAAELGNHVAAMESDLGAEHPLGFHAKISEAAQQSLSPVQDVLRVFGANLIERVPDSPETDIEPLADKGVPAIGVWQNGLTYFKYHHTPADTLDKVIPEELRENAACMAVMGYALANMTDPLAR